MNIAFYLALDRLPMSLVAAIEFVGIIGVALYGMRTRRNLAALALAVVGLYILIDVKWSSDPIGLFWAGLNGALFIGYVVLGHKAAEGGANGGVERLGAAMAIAFMFVMPIGFVQALHAFGSAKLVLAGIGGGHLLVGHSLYLRPARHVAAAARDFRAVAGASSATATIVALIVLAQVPTIRDISGIALVMIGVALHRPARQLWRRIWRPRASWPRRS